MRDSVFYTRRVLRILRCTRCSTVNVVIVTVPRPDQSLHRRVCPSIRGEREREGISEQWCDESRKMQCVNQSRSRADCLAAAPLTHIVSPILIPHYPVIFRAGDTFTNHPVLLSYIPAFVRLFLTRCPWLPAVWFEVSTDFRILCWWGWSIYTLLE